MKEIGIVCAGGLFIKEFLSGNYSRLYRSYINNSYNVIFIIDHATGKNEVYYLNKITQDDIDKINQERYNCIYPNTRELLVMIGIDRNNLLVSSTKLEKLNFYVTDLFDDQENNCIDNKRVNDYFKNSNYFMHDFDAISINNPNITSRYSGDLIKDLKDRINGEDKLIRQTYVIKTAIEYFFNSMHYNNLISLLELDKFVELLEYIFDSKLKGMLKNVKIRINDNGSDKMKEIIQKVDWNRYMNTSIMESLPPIIYRGVKKNLIVDNENMTESELLSNKYFNILSLIKSPITADLPSCYVFLYSVSDEHFEIVSKILHGSLLRFIIKSYRFGIHKYMTDKERSIKILNMLMNEIELSKKNKEMVITSFLSIKKDMEKGLDEKIDIEYTSDIKRHIIKNSLKG